MVTQRKLSDHAECTARSSPLLAGQQQLSLPGDSIGVRVTDDGISRRRPADGVRRLVFGLRVGSQVFLCQLLLRSPVHGP